VFMTLPEVKEYLRLSRSTIERHVRAGRLRNIQIGKRILFRKTAVDQFVRDCERKTSRTREQSNVAA
jgi:excisionase family DNA binding protein